MKAKRKIMRKHRRIAANVQKNHDEGPAKRWRSGGYHVPGSNKR